MADIEGKIEQIAEAELEAAEAEETNALAHANATIAAASETAVAAAEAGAALAHANAAVMINEAKQTIEENEGAISWLKQNQEAQAAALSSLHSEMTRTQEAQGQILAGLESLASLIRPASPAAAEKSATVDPIQESGHADAQPDTAPSKESPPAHHKPKRRWL